MSDPRVSIVIPNYGSPSVIEVCLTTLQITEGVDYEVVVVDNGSDEATVHALERHRDEGRITTLVPLPSNRFFSGGTNAGVANSNPASSVICCLNSDVAFLRGDWLEKALAWLDGTIEYRPSVWGLQPATPDPGPRDIVSVGWSHDASVLPGNARPEGWLLLVRREWWRDFDENFLWHGGMEHSIAESIRAGAKCGVLSQYSPFLVHMEGASGPAGSQAVNIGAPDIAGWFSGLRVETLDFRLNDNERQSYLWWH